MRQDLNIICDTNDLNDLQLLQNKISCAHQAARPDAIPDEVPEHKAKLFIIAAIDSLGSYKWLEKNWWDEAKKKYNLPEGVNIWIDFSTGMFYLNKE